MKQLFLIFFILLFCQCSSPAQETEIKITIKGAENKKVMFANYYQDDIQLVKEITLDEKGKAVIVFDKKLPFGIYLIIVPEITYFDILIDDDQLFEIQTDLKNPIFKMKIKKSKSNEFFYKHQKEVTTVMEKQGKIIEEIKTLTDSLEIKKLESRISDLDQEITDIWKSEIEKNNSPFFTNMLKAMHVFEVPYGEFYDYVDFSNSGLLKTPFFQNILLYHLSVHIEKPPKEIIKQNDLLISKTKSDSSMYKYVTFFLLSQYKDICKFGINEVFIDLSDKYFLNGNADAWMNKQQIDIITRTTDRYRYSTIGNQTYNFKVLTSTGDSLEFYDIKSKYKLLFFWKIGCGHCEEAADTLRNNYEAIKNQGFEILAINTDCKSIDKWQKYIKKHNYNWYNGVDLKSNYATLENYYVCSSPLIYIIDKNNIIIGKLYGQTQINNFVEKQIKK